MQTGKELKSQLSEQCRCIAKGIEWSNESYPLIYEYSNKKVLSELGYSFDINELTQFEAECFIFIDSEFKKLEREMSEDIPKGKLSKGSF